MSVVCTFSWKRTVINKSQQQQLNAIGVNVQNFARNRLPILDEVDSWAGFANTASGPTNNLLFNGTNNPFVVEKITRFADTPNVVIVRITDKNGQVFNPAKGEVAKRPNSGLNPTPPFLQNLQDYAPDIYKALDTAMFLKFPLVPFPIASLGNGYNVYYRIPTKFVHIDSTATWAANVGGGYYPGQS
ncbi:hypothetical protein QTN47_03655 [Danxiaibacter flavus]|uniref:Uncharacterized protein n=1 Tax=Danxiaibacter flavus TaxID=3049108 RepID=A0ABV3Z9P2_9BACT|nr:hypothetical protein QNM32_03655 [Chitinophagaceae bacterium DXS]